MNRTHHNLMILLMVFYGLAEAHVVDIHIITPGEAYQIEQNEKQLDIQNNLEIMQDENRSEEDRRAALETLVELGGFS